MTAQTNSSDTNLQNGSAPPKAASPRTKPPVVTGALSDEASQQSTNSDTNLGSIKWFHFISFMICIYNPLLFSYYSHERSKPKIIVSILLSGVLQIYLFLVLNSKISYSLHSYITVISYITLCYVLLPLVIFYFM